MDLLAEHRRQELEVPALCPDDQQLVVRVQVQEFEEVGHDLLRRRRPRRVVVLEKPDGVLVALVLKLGIKKSAGHFLYQGLHAAPLAKGR